MTFCTLTRKHIPFWILVLFIVGCCRFCTQIVLFRTTLKSGYTSHIILVLASVRTRKEEEKRQEKSTHCWAKPDLLGFLLIAKSLLGTEGSNVGGDQDIKLLLQLGTVAKEEKDLPDNKVRSKNKSCTNNIRTKKGFWVTIWWEIGN